MGFGETVLVTVFAVKFIDALDFYFETFLGTEIICRRQ